jgi:hypothetical protein
MDSILILSPSPTFQFELGNQRPRLVKSILVRTARFLDGLLRGKNILKSHRRHLGIPLVARGWTEDLTFDWHLDYEEWVPRYPMTLARQRPCGLHWRHWLERPARVRHGSACHGSEPFVGRFAPRRNGSVGDASLRKLCIKRPSGDSARPMRGRENVSEPERPQSSSRSSETLSLSRDVDMI